jgi:quercetin dioxygenase-like cupin family protein
MTPVYLQQLPAKEMFPGFFGKFIHTADCTVAYWQITAGASIPLHKHIHQQIMHIIDGEFEFTINGTTSLYTKDMIVVIESNVEHCGKAITNCVIMDVFTPIREDYC